MAGIYATKTGKDFAQVEPGTYMARCISMIEIGTYDYEYKGEVQTTHKVHLTWELPTELNVFDEFKGEQPFAVSKSYNLSMNKKSNLRKDLETWRGKAYTEEEAEKIDVTKLLGQPCQITIVHKPKVSDPTKTTCVVENVNKLMKGNVCPPQINPSTILCYEDFDWDIYEGLSDWMKKEIQKSEEFQSLKNPVGRKTPVNTATPNNDKGDENNDLPF